ncbi:hypothetical protein PIB30_016379 [Stylosanthes scabra]|uniref:Uncharacterized protein n=1 Tax=Stylosanthes scabra TaxID=79078 RepID=A0ABU6T743_9FABA|nr:hypothetical protein [Stylosanthes scabra]
MQGDELAVNGADVSVTGPAWTSQERNFNRYPKLVVEGKEVIVLGRLTKLKRQNGVVINTAISNKGRRRRGVVATSISEVNGGSNCDSNLPPWGKFVRYPNSELVYADGSVNKFDYIPLDIDHLNM